MFVLMICRMIVFADLQLVFMYMVTYVGMFSIVKVMCNLNIKSVE